MADPRICSVEGCDKTVMVKSRGLCSTHYHRFARHGSTEVQLRPANGEMMEFLRDEVFGSQEADQCINWPFSRMRTGYGKVTVNGKRFLAHRYVCSEAHGPAPTNSHQAAHSCGNASCVNPHHIRWATVQENIDDKKAHGTKLVGCQLTWTKLQETDVREIRKSLASGESVNNLSRKYGVARYTIFAIKSGRNWSWLE